MNRPGRLEASGAGGESPWKALYRLAIGFSLVPVFTWWQGESDPGWRLLPFFLLVLLGIRLVSTLGRRVLPFRDDLRARWARQRLLAKQFDSYQWRKLLWFGLGLAVYLGLAGRAPAVPTALAFGCLLAGGIGALRWRRIAGSEQVAVILSRSGHRPALTT